MMKPLAYVVAAMLTLSLTGLPALAAVAVWKLIFKFGGQH
jgi:hypothetical protein